MSLTNKDLEAIRAIIREEARPTAAEATTVAVTDERPVAPRLPWRAPPLPNPVIESR